MLIPKRTFVCPYCFERCELAQVQLRCTNSRCGDFDDKEMTKYESGNKQMPKQGKRTFSVPSKNPFAAPSSGRCPECGNITYKRICPACHNELPESTLSGTDMIISVVGSRASGKSHFVGVLIEELLQRVASKFGGSLEGFADSYARWKNGFYTSLYENRQKLPLNQSALQNPDNGTYRPLIFKLNFRRRVLFWDVIDSYTLVFFDTAGEDLDDPNIMNTVNKYICKSAGIIFLLDPMQIPAVVNRLDSSIVERASAVRLNQAAKPNDIMTRVSQMIRNDRHMPQNRVIDIPVAAVFSKFDAIEPIVPEDFTVRRPSPHCEKGYFDMTDCHNVNSQIQALLNAWNATAFTSQLETNYKNYSYFAVSALGNNPTKDDRIEPPHPHRIEDPLLWILKENGVIKGKGR